MINNIEKITPAYTFHAQYKNFSNLDICKFICSLLVIIIHTSPLENISSLGHFYLTNVLARIAVPLFFSISGFFLFRKFEWKNGKITPSKENFIQLWRYLKKLCLLYSGWSAVYILVSIPNWYKSGWWGFYVIKDVIFAFFTKGTYYHLWYLLACIYAVPILFAVYSMFSRQKIIWLMSILWILECLTYSYSWLGINSTYLITLISERVPIVFDTIFRSVPLISIGIYVAETRPVKFQKYGWFAALSSFLLCAAEASLLYFCTPNEGKYSYIFMTPLLAYTTLRILIGGKQANISEKASYILRNASPIIYYVHPLIILICDNIGIWTGISMWLAVTGITVCIAFLWGLFKIHVSTHAMPRSDR